MTLDEFIQTRLLTEEELREYDHLFEELLSKEFSTSDLDIAGVTPKLLHDWNKQGITLYPTNERKRRKFSFEEFSWFLALGQMRNFGLSIAHIKRFKEHCAINMDVTKALSDDLVAEQMSKMIPGLSLEEAKMIVASDELKEMITSRLNFTTFGLMIMDSVIRREGLSLMILEDGDFLPVKPRFLNGYLKYPQFLTLLQRPYFNLSIVEIVSAYLGAKLNGRYEYNFDVVTPKEKEILEVIRAGKCNSLEIIFKDGKVERLESTKEIKVYSQNQLAEIITSDGYQDISIKTQKGKIVSVKNTKKKKF